MVRLMPLCLLLFGAFGKDSPPLHGATCDEEAQDEFSTLQVASKLQPIAAEEVQKRDDTKRMREDEVEEDEEGEDEEDEAGEDEDKEDVEAVAALQTASRRRRGAHRRRAAHRRRRQPAGGHRRRVAGLQTESHQNTPDLQDGRGLQDDVIFLDQIEDKFGAYMRALREFQSNRELLTRQDKQATVNELRQWAVAEADEMMKLSDLLAVNEAELEGEEDAEEAAGEEDDEEADHNEDHEEVAGEEESKSDQETTLDMPALTSVMAPNQPDGNLLQTDVDVASRRRSRVGDHRRRGGSNDRRRFFSKRRRRGDDHDPDRRRNAWH